MKQTKRLGETFGGVDQALPIMRQHQSMTSSCVEHEPESPRCRTHDQTQ
jgi:hypothetical protein